MWLSNLDQVTTNPPFANMVVLTPVIGDELFSARTVLASSASIARGSFDTLVGRCWTTGLCLAGLLVFLWPNDEIEWLDIIVFLRNYYSPDSSGDAILIQAFKAIYGDRTLCAALPPVEDVYGFLSSPSRCVLNSQSIRPLRTVL